MNKLFTDRNNDDPSAFSDDATAASLFVRDRAMSEKWLLNADCGTLQSEFQNVHQTENTLNITDTTASCNDMRQTKFSPTSIWKRQVICSTRPPSERSEF